MYFSSWQQVLLMQGHGIYVWPAYVVGIGVLVIFGLVLRLRTRHAFRTLQKQLMRSKSAHVVVENLSSEHIKVEDPNVGLSS